MLRITVALVGLLSVVGVSSINVNQESDDEHNEMLRWAQKVKAGAEEPDDWWLKTCSGWTALMMCGAVFGAGIDEDVAREEDVSWLFGLPTDIEMDYDRKTVKATCNWNPTGGAATYTCVFRDGIGCTLVEGMTEAELRAQDTGDMRPPPPLDPATPWPFGEQGPTGDVPQGVNMTCVRDITARQFADTGANPRAITVVYREQLIHEQYADTVNKDTRLIGWSATKSVVNGLLGILAGEGRINVFAPAPVPEWTDNRTQITLDEMLHMVSGTPWGFDPLTTTWCLFDSDGDCANYCAENFLLESTPGSRYEYNSGSTYILSRVVNQERGEPELTNFEWPKRRLFYPIGAHSFYIEPQTKQNFLGGALGYATARDWARFGLLYLRDGVWIDGTRILPDGWVAYTRTGSTASPGYGAHWRKGMNVEPDLFFATGFRNENVYVFPNQNLVLTRHAMPDPLFGGWNQNNFLRGMLTCFDDTNTNTNTKA